MKKILALALLAPSIAFANFETGNSLYSDLNSHDANHRIVAMGYVKGAFDMQIGTKICLTSGYESITVGQVVDIVKKFLDDYPEVRNYSAAAIVGVAAGAVWPCGKSM